MGQDHWYAGGIIFKTPKTWLFCLHYHANLIKCAHGINILTTGNLDEYMLTRITVSIYRMKHDSVILVFWSLSFCAIAWLLWLSIQLTFNLSVMVINIPLTSDYIGHILEQELMPTECMNTMITNMATRYRIFVMLFVHRIYMECWMNLQHWDLTLVIENNVHIIYMECWMNLQHWDLKFVIEDDVHRMSSGVEINKNMFSIYNMFSLYLPDIRPINNY